MFVIPILGYVMIKDESRPVNLKWIQKLHKSLKAITYYRWDKFAAIED